MRVYDKEFVHELFGFSHPGSTRKLMSRHGFHAVTGYRVEDVEEALRKWEPDRAWDRSPLEDQKRVQAVQDELRRSKLGTGRPATNRRKK